MILGKVIGQVYSTINHEFYKGKRLLIVEKIDPVSGKEKGYITAIDTVGSASGQTVLLLDEGNSARQILNVTNAPVRTVIVGIVDDPIL